jgi:Acetyltransferases
MIRWRQPRDTKGIVKLVRSQLVPKSPWAHPRDGRLYSEVAERLRNGSTLVAAKNRGGDPYGFLHMVIQNKVLFIDLLAVDPAYQNRRWGTELMHRAEEYGRKKGCNRSMLYVDKDNARGIRFYSRLGYSNVQYVEALLCYRMEKKLDPEPGWLWDYAAQGDAQRSPASAQRSASREQRQRSAGNGQWQHSIGSEQRQRSAGSEQRQRSAGSEQRQRSAGSEQRQRSAGRPSAEPWRTSKGNVSPSRPGNTPAAPGAWKPVLGNELDAADNSWLLRRI